MIAALLVLQAAAPLPPERLGDWTVVCDNQRRCEALAQVPAGGVERDHALLALRRDAAATADIALDIPIPADVAAGTRIALAIDGRTLAQLVAPGGGGGLSLPFAGELAAALRRGLALTLVDPRGQVRARASLAGLSAALAAFDAAQRGAGGHAATLPVVAVPPATARPARVPSRKDVARLVGPGQSACGPIVSNGYRLDAQHTLVVVEPPCNRNAYARTSWLYVLPESGAGAPAVFDVPAAAAGAPAQQVDGGWDPVRRRVAALLPARGGLDCGTLRDYAWDGQRFRLVEERVVVECRRATRQFTTWRAQVTSR